MRLRNDEDLGRFIRARRQELGLTQQQLATCAGVRRATLVAVERGQSHPAFATAVALLQVLDVALVTRTSEPDAAQSLVPKRRRVDLAEVLSQVRAER